MNRLRLKKCSFLVLVLVTGALQSFQVAFGRSKPAPPINLPSPTIGLAYHLGAALYYGPLKIVELDRIIKSEGKHRNPKYEELALRAQSARSDELRACQTALVMLRKLGAPKSIALPYEAAARTFAATMNQSAALETETTDRNAAIVLSVLDEAEKTWPRNDGALAVWLKLARGTNALWAMHLGEVGVSIHDVSEFGRDMPPVVDTSPALAATMPAGWPTNIADRLRAVAAQVKSHGRVRAEAEALDSALTLDFGEPMPPVTMLFRN